MTAQEARDKTEQVLQKIKLEYPKKMADYYESYIELASIRGLKRVNISIYGDEEIDKKYLENLGFKIKYIKHFGIIGSRFIISW